MARESACERPQTPGWSGPGASQSGSLRSFVCWPPHHWLPKTRRKRRPCRPSRTLISCGFACFAMRSDDGRSKRRLGPGARVQRDDEVEGAKPQPPPIIPAEDSFDDWAFGGKDGERRFRAQLDKLLQRKIQDIEQVFLLTEAQRRKLKLAGRGDIQRLLEMVEDARSEFQLARTNLRRLTELQKNLRLVELRVSDGLFEIGSLFAKTLRKLVEEKQLARRSANLVR